MSDMCRSAAVLAAASRWRLNGVLCTCAICTFILHLDYTATVSGVMGDTFSGHRYEPEVGHLWNILRICR